MARRVNLKFGGQRVATWATASSIFEAYRALADQYGLLKPSDGFFYVFDQGELAGCMFFFEKHGLLESGLQSFNDIWADIAVDAGILREPTQIVYYEDEA